MLRCFAENICICNIVKKGLTPVSSLPGATRSGTVDPSLIFHYTNKISHDPNLVVPVEVTQVGKGARRDIAEKAGWKSITGSANFKDIVQNAHLNHHPCEMRITLSISLSVYSWTAFWTLSARII